MGALAASDKLEVRRREGEVEETAHLAIGKVRIFGDQDLTGIANETVNKNGRECAAGALMQRVAPSGRA